jgi:superfamily II DNA or RNA helicase
MALGLWPHQRDAVGASVRALAGGGRASLVSACGTGKTRTASAVVNELARHGRNLVTVPTLELAAQTVRQWRDAADGPLGTVVVVCSDPAVLSGRDIDLGGGAVVTTAPGEIAAASAVGGRVTMLSTYDSVPMVAAAHAHHDLPRWDCVVVDEAHRTVGAPGGAWTSVHDDHLVPAARRLYMTATPRVSGSSAAEAIAMDEESVFGPVCYRLTFGKAIELGLLADYRLIVPVITDGQVRTLAARDGAPHLRVGNAALSPEALAVQVAVLRAMGHYRIRRAISYHPRIEAARAWALTVPQTTELVPDGPPSVWAAHLEGDHPGRHRRRVLDRLGASGDEVCLVANAKVLAEGVDVPAVDAVIFTSTRDAPIDTVQAVGRALRTGGAVGKVASIVVPLLLGPGEDPEVAATSSGWAPVWQVISALRDHDERLETALVQLRRGLGAGSFGPVGRLPDWFHVRGVPVPSGFARAITVRAVRATVPKWEEYYGACEAFYKKYGHLDVPRHFRVGELDIGDFIKAMRTSHRRGRLTRRRADLLTAIGMIWNAEEARWERNYRLACEFREDHGHLLIPDSYIVEDEFGIQRWVGKWISVQRQLRADLRLRADRARRLNAIGMIWEVHEHLWERGYREAERHASRHGNLDVRIDHITATAYPLGQWLYSQYVQMRDGVLTVERANRLRRLDSYWATYWSGDVHVMERRERVSNG